MIQKSKKMIGFLCTVLMIALFCQTAFAASGSLTVNYDQNGVVFHAYQVATRQADSTWLATEAFAPYQVDFNTGDSYDTAATLASYVSRDKLSATASSRTANGSVTFSTLDAGLYLVVGEQSVSGGYTYTPVPFLIEISTINMVVEAKYERTPKIDQPETASYKVKKVWAGEGTDTHPDSVTIQLLQNGNVYDEVTLSASNGWRHTWLNLDTSSHWKVVEKDVPAGYTVAITQDDTAFVVTNTRSASSANPPDHLSAQNPSNQSNKPGSLLPQTGQLWWPIPLLAAIGMIIFIFGWSRRKRGNDEQK